MSKYLVEYIKKLVQETKMALKCVVKHLANSILTRVFSTAIRS